MVDEPNTAMYRQSPVGQWTTEIGRGSLLRQRDQFFSERPIHQLAYVHRSSHRILSQHRTASRDFRDRSTLHDQTLRHCPGVDLSEMWPAAVHPLDPPALAGRNESGGKGLDTLPGATQLGFEVVQQLSTAPSRATDAGPTV
jgi:hypothetical protein